MSYKIYPMTKTEHSHNGYEIKINGKEVTPDTARVSAVSFNRRWPGHQRSIDQTELINFLSLETEEALKFEIKPQKPFEEVVIRPVTLGIKPQVTEDGTITFTLEKPAYFTVEPYGRRNALHIFADPVSDYNISPGDESVIYYGKGEHDVGMINLKSNETLFLDEGAVVYACVRAIDADNIKILGRGILDNSRNKEQILYDANEENNTAAVNNAIRLHTIQLEYCNNIKIEGITIRDSLVYNIRPVGCENVEIENVKIIGCWRYNSDGIDMHNCINVSINNCFLRTFDDCICVKGFDCYYEGDVEEAVRKAMYRNGKSYDVFRKVRVKNCVLWNDWARCFEVGAETRAEEICDVIFEDSNAIHVSAAPLDCTNVDYADVHDITYRNITIEYDDNMIMPQIQHSDDHKFNEKWPYYETPTLVKVEVVYDKEYSAGGVRRGKNRNLLFENIYVYSKYKPLFQFCGYDEESSVSEVTVKNFFLNGKPMKKSDCVISENEFCKNINVDFPQ